LRLSLPPLLLPLPLLLLPWSLAQAARARLPASSSAAVFVIRAARKTISSLGDASVSSERVPSGSVSRATSRPSPAES